ncbi:MAG TPA: hypothetical protein VF503_25625 [Sphingobium sp.]|uniref:hypothetical protein n=1 Tax=Sphingobium sp. TaxID=1912891 RepID=UPI002ED0FCE6
MSNESGEATITSETTADESTAAPSVKQSAKETVASLKAAAGSAKDAASAAASHAKETGEAWREQASTLAGQAADSARAAATTAKDKTGTALHGLAKLISDTAETVDGKLGPQYGDYARQAAESVAGAAKSLDEKDVDQLVTDARDFVRKSPAVAIGAAALVGFVLMRLARGGSDSKES